MKYLKLVYFVVGVWIRFGYTIIFHKKMRQKTTTKFTNYIFFYLFKKLIQFFRSNDYPDWVLYYIMFFNELTHWMEFEMCYYTYYYTYIELEENYHR